MQHIRSAESIILLIIIFFVGLLGYALIKGTPKVIEGMHTYNVTFGGVPMTVIIADEPDEYYQGLTVFKRLPRNQGMLFVFDRDERWRVSTKGLHFPIDIFWIDKEGKVVDMQKYAPPSEYLYIYEPRVKARYILQTNADFADVHNIEIGDYLRFER